jgi:WD40 repeat protein
MRRSPDPCMIYSTQYSKHDNGEIIIAGGSKSNEIRFFDTMNYNKPFAGVLDFEKGIFSCDFSHQGSMAAVGSSDGMARIYNISKLG